MSASLRRLRLSAICLLLPWAGMTAGADGAASAAAPAAARAARADAVFAQVGDTVITLGDYQRALAVAVRNKYYHAKPPEGELAKFQREVGDDVVNRVLLLAEAKRRGLKPEASKIEATVAGYDAQYKSSPNWQANRDKMLAAVVPRLEGENLLEQLQRQVREVPEPADAVARSYYERHKELFVEPEQVKFSVILLRVDPSSPAAKWRAADEEGQRLHAKLVAGADFAELAKLHSADRSAQNGGQMEYTHRGMLPEAVQQVLEKMAVGVLAEPVRLLEGVAILRLDGRKPALQRRFEDVRTRAGDLWQREQADARWQRLIDELRRSTSVRIDESHYAPLRGSNDKPSAS